MKDGTAMADIDRMDIFGYWKIQAWSARRRAGLKHDGPAFIDDLF